LIRQKLIIPHKDLTSGDLAKGNPLIEQIFAWKLIEFKDKKKSPKKDQIYITVFRIGEVAVIGLPGEPFVDIGLAIKSKSPFKYTLICGNANGYAGHIPLESHFKNGGYEVRTTPYNRFAKGLGRFTIRKSIETLQTL